MYQHAPLMVVFVDVIHGEVAVPGFVEGGHKPSPSDGKVQPLFRQQQNQ
jgi:hypothetical protein